MFVDVQTFFETYSLSDMILFVILLSSALIGAGKVADEVSMRIRNLTDRENRKNKRDQEINDRFRELENKQAITDATAAELQKTMVFFADKLEILVDSDKDSIKAYLTDKHHYYVDKGWIDDYNRDCIERRYVHYKKAGGNSFVDHLMEEIRELPNYPSPMKKE